MGKNNNNRLWLWLGVMRPGQWVKNAFVLAPLLFSGKFVEPGACWKALAAFGSFCAISSAIYALNDLCDRPEDRAHPVKKERAIAQGAVSVAEAGVLMAVLVLLSGWGAWYLGWRYGAILGVYAGLHVAYSVGLKHVVILDVMTIGGGFVLRILGGSVAIAVVSSHWLILCTIMISVFLGFTKRRAELVSTETQTGTTRRVLADYSRAFLDQAIAVVTGATILCYALYTVDDETMRRFGSRAMLLTVPSVMYGMFRYIYIIYHLEKEEDPTRAICRDVPMIINLVIWVLLALVVVEYGQRIPLLG